MMTLMEELTSTENKVAFARQAYNDAVMSYNTARESFPTNMIAGPFNFGRRRALCHREAGRERSAQGLVLMSGPVAGLPSGNQCRH